MLKMHSFIICTSPLGNSVSNYFFSLAHQLKKDGHTVLIVVDRAQKNNTEFNGIPVLSWPSKRPTKWADVVFFYKLCTAHKPTAVLGQFGSTNISLLASWWLSIPNRINYWHTMFKQLQVDVRVSTFKAKMEHFLKRNILHICATHVFTNSIETKKDLAQHYAIAEQKLGVFHLLIPDATTNHTIQPLTARKQQISFVGRIDKSKGQSFVIEAIPSIIKKFPQLLFVFVGDGIEKNKLEALCIQLNITNNVQFVGRKNAQEVFDIMGSSLININASIEEAFGLVNVEALSLATPIIAPKTGGIKEIIEDGVNGYFFNPANAQDLLEKIELIVNNWSQFSQQARLSYVQKFSVNNQELLQKQTQQLVSLLR
jgi:glycosyltransferase involved in cell wall biosynthesis